MIETFVTVFILALDQLTKYLTDVFLMPLGTSYPLWEGVFHFTSSHNTGAAFGIFAGGRWLFILLTIVACVAIVWFMVKERKRMSLLMRIAFALILGGALGNLIDRLLLGYVRDMLDFCLIDFAIFNVADSAVSVGAVCLVLDVIFFKGKTLFDSPKPEQQGVDPVKPNAETQSPDASTPDQTRASAQTEENRGQPHNRTH